MSNVSLVSSALLYIAERSDRLVFFTHIPTILHMLSPLMLEKMAKEKQALHNIHRIYYIMVYWSIYEI